MGQTTCTGVRPWLGMWVIAGLLASPWSLAQQTQPNETEKPQATRALQVGGIEPVNPEQASQRGALRVKVRFEGEQKPRREIDMSLDQGCCAVRSETARDERYIFGEESTLQNVLVYVSSPVQVEAEEVATLPQPRLTQHGCMFTPRVQGVMAGQALDIYNDDPLLHNVRTQTQHNGNFNEGMTQQGDHLAWPLHQPELAIKFRCDVHPWMAAYVHVLPHPFFAVTQQTGRVEIRGLPAGEHEVTVWHELRSLRPLQATQKLTILPGQVTEAEFVYRPASER